MKENTALSILFIAFWGMVGSGIYILARGLIVIYEAVISSSADPIHIVIGIFVLCILAIVVVGRG